MILFLRARAQFGVSQNVRSGFPSRIQTLHRGAVEHVIDRPNRIRIPNATRSRWNPGLSDAAITEYERDMGVRFPHDFTAFLQAMNGTDLPTLNVYGYCGEPLRRSTGVYSYPRDIETVRWRVRELGEYRKEIAADLADQGFLLPADAGFVAIYGHRYLLCTSDPDSSVVLSIVVRSVDAIVYAKSLKEYLEKDFLSNPRD
jgi:hypothetical protein